VKKHIYYFVSNWSITAPLEHAADTIADYRHWTTWWRGLESATVLHAEPSVGAQVACIWKSATGYRLHSTVTITAYRHNQYIAFDSTGDLVGSGEWHFEPIDDSHTGMRIVWNVHSEKWWMNAFAWLLRPLFVKNHDLLMAAGERGLNDFLQNKQ